MTPTQHKQTFTKVYPKTLNNKLSRYIYRLLLERGPMTREDIARITKLPRTTIYDHLMKLTIKGVIEKYSVITNKRGRPPVYYRIANVNKLID